MHGLLHEPFEPPFHQELDVQPDPGAMNYCDCIIVTVMHPIIKLLLNYEQRVLLIILVHNNMSRFIPHEWHLLLFHGIKRTLPAIKMLTDIMQ